MERKKLKYKRRGHPLYEKYKNMHKRCYYEGYPYFHLYGGRGIEVCERWHDFDNFVDDTIKMGLLEKGMTLDRIDNDGDYSPENCRAATPGQQGNNRRDNVILEYKGVAKSLPEWAREYGLNPERIRARLFKLGWDVDKALNTPTPSSKGNLRIDPPTKDRGRVVQRGNIGRRGERKKRDHEP